MKKLKPIFLNLTVLATTLIVLLVALEFTVKYTAFTDSERETGVYNLWLAHQNSFVNQFSQNDGCPYTDIVLPHPYLSHVFAPSTNDMCSLPHINNKGMDDERDIEPVRNPNYFSVMVIGGSLAHQLAKGRYRPTRLIWLEDELNRNYVSPNGKPFRVFNGGGGGWKVPLQNFMMTLYGNKMDGMISLDGFNEASHVVDGRPIDIPVTEILIRIYHLDNFFTQSLLDFLKNWRRWILRSKYFKNSYLGFVVFKAGMNFIDSPGVSERRRENIDRYFQFPQEYTSRQKENWSKQEYIKYQRLLNASAKELGIKYAHFLQPIPALQKPLAPAEKPYADFIFPASLYERVFMPAVEELKKGGNPSVSLVDLFKDHPEELYADFVHFKFQENADSTGYRILANRIAQELSKLWKLKRRTVATGI